VSSNVSFFEGEASFLVSDTYPKEVVIVDTSETDLAGELHNVGGWIDLSNLQSGDSMYINTKPVRYGVKIVLRMDTAPSVDTVIPYQLFAER